MGKKQCHIILYLPIESIQYIVKHSWNQLINIMDITKTIIHYNLIDNRTYFLIRGDTIENVNNVKMYILTKFKYKL